VVRTKASRRFASN
ncbi:glutamate decarboxylase alpha domain protein, partial [Escherichia coli EC1868]